jgi:hypothetical protein
MKVYVDDMLVKSIRADRHILDLMKTFWTLIRYGMKLNPSKCAFGISSGKFLGFIVSRRGIEDKLEKVRAVLDMQSLGSTKQLQQLTKRIATLNRFISRSTNKCLPIFQNLEECLHME